MGTLTTPQLLLLLVAMAQSGSALRCWSCQSDTNPDCKDPFEAADHGPSACVPILSDRDKLRSGAAPVCTKARIHVNEQESYVMRTCEWVSDSYPSFCQHHPQLPSHSRMEFCESCRGDGCNGAGLPAASSWVLAASGFFLGVLVFLQ